jgi:hypothetical protein
LEGKSISSSKGSSWFEEHLICKLGSKVASPIILFCYPLRPILFLIKKVVQELKDISWIEDVVECTPTILFMNNFTIDVVGFVNPHKVVVKRSAFSTLANVHEMKMFQTLGQKVQLMDG